MASPTVCESRGSTPNNKQSITRRDGSKYREPPRPGTKPQKHG
nr:MAG TPA: hypothetical protein [Bacteriophage sp.]